MVLQQFLHERRPRQIAASKPSAGSGRHFEPECTGKKARIGTYDPFTLYMLFFGAGFSPLGCRAMIISLILS